ncbi:MAG: hypothetical protein A2Y33_03870 [Spirochaetes bacterium GWF1_51_8]|nr:MAG: hypothetical protein A2Y33_03870 [Spirochaetes bacterium GWF1_51_8]
MPNYDYRCTECGTVNEIFHKITEDPEIKCPSCGSAMKRKISGGAGLMFKGSGYYVNDYKKSGAPSAASTESASTATPASAPSPATTPAPVSGDGK